MTVGLLNIVKQSTEHFVKKISEIPIKEPRQLDPMVREDPEKGEGIQVEIRGDRLTAELGGDWRDSASFPRMVGQYDQHERKGKRLGDAYFPRTQKGSRCLGGNGGQRWKGGMAS